MKTQCRNVSSGLDTALEAVDQQIIFRNLFSDNSMVCLQKNSNHFNYCHGSETL